MFVPPDAQLAAVCQRARHGTAAPGQYRHAGRKELFVRPTPWFASCSQRGFHQISSQAPDLTACVPGSTLSPVPVCSGTSVEAARTLVRIPLSGARGGESSEQQYFCVAQVTDLGMECEPAAPVVLLGVLWSPGSLCQPSLSLGTLLGSLQKWSPHPGDSLWGLLRGLYACLEPHSPLPGNWGVCPGTVTALALATQGPMYSLCFSFILPSR